MSHLPTLCLNMIVKNESKIIVRLLDSVVDLLDSYCICDTGSTDTTVDLIQQYFASKNIPGKIVQEPFQDFGYNRTYALKACETIDPTTTGKDDYINKNNYLDNAVPAERMQFRSADPFVEESRASQPAWTYRDLEQTRWEEPFLNPQANLEKKFHDNIQTRILEKDFFVQPTANIMTNNIANYEFHSMSNPTSGLIPNLRGVPL